MKCAIGLPLKWDSASLTVIPVHIDSGDAVVDRPGHQSRASAAAARGNREDNDRETCSKCCPNSHCPPGLSYLPERSISSMR
jgi:hypothetical protein